MSLYLIAGIVITLAVIGIAISMRETKAERAQQYPLGSTERRSLEGHTGVCRCSPIESNTGSTPARQRRNRTLAPTLQRKEGP